MNFLTNSLINRFWKYCYKLSKRKLKEAHTKQFLSDIKCPNCNRWFSESSFDGHKHEHVAEPSWGFHVRCGQCDHESFWNAEIAPILIRCDKTGNPL